MKIEALETLLRSFAEKIREEMVGKVEGMRKEKIEYGLDNYEHPEADQVTGYNQALNEVLNLIDKE